MISEFVQETGARKIRSVSTKFSHSSNFSLSFICAGTESIKLTYLRNMAYTHSMAFFPQEALHLEFKPTCEEVVFLAAFNSEDPSINTPAESLFMLDDKFASLALGLEFLPGANNDNFRTLVPATLAQGVENCLKRCGIEKNEL
jgi:hypothetical protein